jgi:hypothetical protein
MQRLYVKACGGWEIVGWVCLNCGYTELEKEKFPVKAYKTVKAKPGAQAVYPQTSG